MAVVQISKIQQRRGQKLLTGGIPQLSSGELAWAVDTQELFIGNGSVSEGAPYVGNTRILTEHDNILELAASYRFAEPDYRITASIPRSLQSKLDEIQVSVLDFGPEPDPSTNYLNYFEDAFNQLFQNPDPKYKKVLVVPNGYYYFTGVLRIPSNVIIRGETRDGVILDIGLSGIEFLSENNTDNLNFTSTDRPQNVQISNLTILYTKNIANTSGGETNLTGVKDSIFENVRFICGHLQNGTIEKDYVIGDTVSTPVQASQSYDLSSIQSTGNIEISGTGLNVSPKIQVFTSDVVTTIQALITDLNSDTTFDNNFIASRSAESLVITVKVDAQESGLTAQDIESRFLIQLQRNNTSSQFVVEPTATLASTGINNTPAAITWSNNNFGTRTTNIKFIDCFFDTVPLAIKCLHTHSESDAFETEIDFVNCHFKVCDTGIYIEGVADRQKNSWKFKDCKFEEVAKQALLSTFGTNTLIDDCDFRNVGNGVNGAAYPEVEMVSFGTKFGNVVVNCKSDRHQMAGLTLVDTAVGVPEVINAGSVEFVDDYYADIYLSDTFTPLAVFSTHHRYIIVDYTLTLGEYNYNRKGQLVITFADNVGDINDHIAIADNFTYTPSLVTDLGGPLMTNFEFGVTLKDNTIENDDSTLASVGSRTPDTVILTYKNPIAFAGLGKISYKLRYGV